MTFTDYLGFAGVFMILVAYFLNLRGWLSVDHLVYVILNCIGAFLACLASIIMEYLPFVLLEGTWFLVSAVALWRRFRGARTRGQG